jgi:hypothetical protein
VYLPRSLAEYSPWQAPRILLLAVLIGCQAAAGEPATPLGALPTREEIEGAVAKLRADPNLGGQKTIRTLRWSGGEPSATLPPASPPWFVGLFEFLAQTSSVLLWVTGAVGAAAAAVWVIRTFRSRPPSAKEPPPRAAVRVGQFDIRPLSLPSDIGAAALALLDAGRARDALSLLYRGALSRAVHRHGAVIGESYTEGEALEAVNARLDPLRVAYFADLVALWQRAVYGGESAPHARISSLCTAFSPTLDSVAP